MLRQGYRLYGAALILWAAFTTVWSTPFLQLPTTTIGYGWITIAAAGIPLALGLYVTRADVFTGKPRTINRFNNHSLSGWPLGLYCAALVVWSGVFAGWLLGLTALSPTIVASGWFVIAGYGALLTIGLVTLHRDKVLEAAHIRTPDKDTI